MLYSPDIIHDKYIEDDYYSWSGFPLGTMNWNKKTKFEDFHKKMDSETFRRILMQLSPGESGWYDDTIFTFFVNTFKQKDDNITKYHKKTLWKDPKRTKNGIAWLIQPTITYYFYKIQFKSIFV